MKTEIENIAEEKGRIIAKAIIEKYDEYSYSHETHKVQKEIYERVSIEKNNKFFKTKYFPAFCL